MSAQGLPQPKTVHKAGPAPWSEKEITFSDEKIVLGLPRESTDLVTHCSNDGTTFVNLEAESPQSGSASVPGLFSVSSSGEVKYLSRKVPLDFTSFSVLDFFAGEHTLVTLLEGVKREGTSEPRETNYFLSLSDHSGNGAELLPMNLGFKPIKVALFGSGGFIVLGWDQNRFVPVLALLKEDGTLRRFVNLDDHRHSDLDATYSSWEEMGLSPQVKAALTSLQRAEFVPYGSQVLLTYPGTAKSISVLSAVGEDRTIPMKWPGGVVLHDVLVSGAGYPLIVRAEVTGASGQPASGGASTKPWQALLEFNAYNGSLLREFRFQKPGISKVTCASASTLTAMFLDTVAKPEVPLAGINGQASSEEQATQMVIAVAPRW